ncbi:hypothetical protein BKG76_13055 [Mycobacteroides franklinii]|uniref:Membrane transport protein MMPL domain-containing protein n=1 Tax=Mycobacteroides franklinii TaxID=948102 RepID=A0A1S1LF86_9MYCO|nr:RND family transporter [Mycobacteroides franklinii]OHU22760.1 hypothetical protein BKG76_13055 [Mycobacteroides franklinii]
MGDVIGRFCSRHAVLVIGVWLLAAALGNLFVPQVESTAHAHARGFFPPNSPVNAAGAHMGVLFGGGSGGNLNNLVLESEHPLGPSERMFHDQLLAKLRADPAHLESISDLWSDPLTAQGALSADGKAVYTTLGLAGDPGSARANAALDSVRQAIASTPIPSGLGAYVTGPGASLYDEFTVIDKQMLLITAVTVVLIAFLLLLVYRSVITAAVPLLSVGITLGVARSIVSFLGDRNLIEVSIFSVALLAAMVLGAATDYGIFLIGRYHEARRAGNPHKQALLAANHSVAPVIVASALTIAAALSCLTLADIGLLRSAGIPCAIGILTGMLASLTLSPALIGLAGRHGFLQPRNMRSQASRRWRLVGTLVARWPGPVLVASGLVLLVCALPAIGLRLGFNELAVQPDSTPANRGYQAMDRHFPPNRLMPEIVSIEAGHELRNPAGIIAIERIASKLMEIPGITMVQSASRPAGVIPEQATITNQAGRIGDELDAGVSKLRQRLLVFDRLTPTLAEFSAAVSQLQAGLSSSVNGLSSLGSGLDSMSSGMGQLKDTLGHISRYVDPLRVFINGNPTCSKDMFCSLVLDVVEPIDSAVAATDTLAQGARALGPATADMVKTLAHAARSLVTMRTAVIQLDSMIGELTAIVGDTRTMSSGLTEYLQGLRLNFENSSAGGYYLPEQAWSDPQFQRAADVYFAPDGHATRLLVYGEGQVFGADGALRSTQIVAAVKAATKEGTLAVNTVNIAGFGSATAQLRGYVHSDFVLLAAVALAAVFLIVLVMLRSPVAATVVIGTVVVSYVSALGVSTLIWHDLLGQEFHWSVPSIALIALVAVGADYNLLLTMRMREEAFTTCTEGKVGLRTAMIRTFGGTGGVVTSAGIVFGITMLAMLSSNVLTIEQIGTTIGAGLIIDTLIVRTFVVPSIAGLLGRWFWWSPPLSLLGSLATKFARQKTE